MFSKTFTHHPVLQGREPLFFWRGDWLYNIPEMSHPVPLHYQIFLTEMML